MPDARDPQLDDLRRRARRRLVGAVVLALAAAVLVPMLLESDPKPLGEDVAVRIPPVDDGKFVSKLGDKAKDATSAPRAEPAKPETPKSDATKPEAPKPEAGATPPAAAPAPETWKASREATSGSASAPEAAKAPAPKPPASTETPAAKAPASPPKDVATAKPAEASAPAPAKEPAPAKAAEPPKPAAPAEATKAASAPATPPTDTKAGGYSVQLAAFIDDKGANALAGRLKKSGYPAYTEPYNTSRGTLWRVRVGPYPSRDAAEAARTRLKGDGQNGIITAAAK